MATDVTRVHKNSLKRAESRTVIQINDQTRASYPAIGSYLVAKLPPEAVVTNAYVFTKVVSPTNVVIVGTAEAGTQILSAGASQTLGKTGTFTGFVNTGTGVDVYVGFSAIPTTGDFMIVVEYLEYTKTTGELTQVN